MKKQKQKLQPQELPKVSSPNGYSFTYLSTVSEHRAPVDILFTTPVINFTGVDEVSPVFFNGCDVEITMDFSVPTIKEKLKIPAVIVYRYNQADKTLYGTMQLILSKSLSDEEVGVCFDDFIKFCSYADSLDNILLEEYPTHRITIGVDILKNYYVRQVNIPLPKDHYWLGSIFDTADKMVMYEEFMSCPIMFRRFKRELDMRKISYPEDATHSVMLPIHKREKITGEIMISSRVLHVFEQFQFCQNFLNLDAFPHETAEHMIGKMMMLYPKFCSFMMDLAKDTEDGRIPENHEARFDKAVAEAMKYIEADSELNELYDNYWL